MLYFRAKSDDVDRETNCIMYANELVTRKERKIFFPSMPNDMFEKVRIPRTKTYFIKGIRLEDTDDEERS